MKIRGKTTPIAPKIPGVLRYLNYRLMRVACLFIVPYCYVGIWLSPQEMRPRDYFLDALAKKRNYVTKVALFFTLLSIAARSCDAVLAVKAVQTLKPPYPIWAMSPKEIRLLIEASLWLGEEQEAKTTINEFLKSENMALHISKLLAEYQSYIQNWDTLGKANVDVFVLPALYWEKLSLKLDIEGRLQESIDALHKALRFVPESDPRRHELVARFLTKQASE
jgi:hypothetical protein